MKISSPGLAGALLAAFLFVCLGQLKAQAGDVAAVEAALMKKVAENIEQHRKGDAEITFREESGKPIANAAVEVEQISSQFLFGCIIFDLVEEEGGYRPEQFKHMFKDLFNFAVFPFYWAGYEPRQGMPEWESMLPVIEWCKANGIVTKGHPLVWPASSGKPRWLADYPMEETFNYLQYRVKNVVGGFKGDIDIWDVFNEPVNITAWDAPNAGSWGRQPWDTNLDLVEKAFRWAHSANPRATLILNEFYQIAIPETRQSFYDLVKELQRRGAPLSGLGIQAHEPREEWYPPKRVWETFDKLAELGLPLHITEFHPQSGNKEITGGWRSGTWTEQAQADFAEQMYRLAFGHPAVVSFNIWGLSDRNSWLPKGGLIDEEYRPKPIYDRLKKLIREEWHTSLSAKSDAAGMVKFRGFYGSYKVTLRTADGRERQFELNLQKGGEVRTVFTAVKYPYAK